MFHKKSPQQYFIKRTLSQTVDLVVLCLKFFFVPFFPYIQLHTYRTRVHFCVPPNPQGVWALSLRTEYMRVARLELGNLYNKEWWVSKYFDILVAIIQKPLTKTFVVYNTNKTMNYHLIFTVFSNYIECLFICCCSFCQSNQIA